MEWKQGDFEVEDVETFMIMWFLWWYDLRHEDEGGMVFVFSSDAFELHPDSLHCFMWFTLGLKPIPFIVCTSELQLHLLPEWGMNMLGLALGLYLLLLGRPLVCLAHPCLFLNIFSFYFYFNCFFTYFFLIWFNAFNTLCMQYFLGKWSLDFNMF